MTLLELAEEIREIKSMLSAQAPRPLTLGEAAQYLGLSRSRVYLLTSRAEIPHFKPGGKKIYFQKSDLDAFLLRNRVTPREEIRRELDAEG